MSKTHINDNINSNSTLNRNAKIIKNLILSLLNNGNRDKMFAPAIKIEIYDDTFDPNLFTNLFTNNPEDIVDGALAACQEFENKDKLTAKVNIAMNLIATNPNEPNEEMIRIRSNGQYGNRSKLIGQINEHLKSHHSVIIKEYIEAICENRNDLKQLKRLKFLLKFHQIRNELMAPIADQSNIQNQQATDITKFFNNDGLLIRNEATIPLWHCCKLKFLHRPQFQLKINYQTNYKQTLK